MRVKSTLSNPNYNLKHIVNLEVGIEQGMREDKQGEIVHDKFQKQTKSGPQGVFNIDFK